ncbi:MAG: hypothetical protein K9J16_16435 [Melioribacteraceae bacterium]|nr:hypothetical protein [Melioribacteraceae bacterium]MCF8356304.1 hypothetical protein [Melioribacteraceae bacterium]MCF8395740.1 hypothetical protein [Melioribacteraceae bacterium]MCF8421229.1 hypothetical protein [Melioribacteraceae bacterium]
MYKYFSRFYTLFIVLPLLFSSFVFSQDLDCSSCHTNLKPEEMARLKKVYSTFERGLGIMDKGEISNYLGNYGVLSSFHEYFNNSIHWPKNANAETQYCFGLGLVAAVDGNVITSVVGGPSEKVDWSPKTGSRGKIFSGDVTAPPPDETPFLPLSDTPETWPEGYWDELNNWVNTPSERHWPGHFRINLDPNSSNYGSEVIGEFSSDRDIYAVFDDAENSHPDGPVGIEVEQTAYSYGRPYAEDILFWDFAIHNKSGKQLNNVYIGYASIFRPDYDNEDLINIIDSDNDGNPDFVYVWDRNNTKDGAWANDPTDMGVMGLSILKTPKDIGITDFHYFNREVMPKVDEEMWPVITSSPNDPNIGIPEAFFHGSNQRLDTTHPDSLLNYFPEGAPINFFIMSGPLDLAPDETVNSSVAVVMGSAGSVPFETDTTDLMKNLRIAQQMYERKFQGSGPPATPSLKAYAGNKTVRLAWDSRAEDSVDPLTSERDFEGYKIYRSDDKGKTWGKPITDAFGNVIGYQPLKIFDLIDGIKGQDPAFNQSLGNDSGIKHSFIDDNLINGVEYWYCVTAYDQGNQDPDNLEQSYQSPLGSSSIDANTVSVIPGVNPQNYIPPVYSPGIDTTGAVQPIGGICQGLVKVDVVQPEFITGDDYLVTFVDSVMQVSDNDTTYVLGFNLYSISSESGDTVLLLDHYKFSDETLDNLPIVDGFRLTVFDSPAGVEFIGWTKIHGDTCTFDWRTGPIEKYQGRQDIVPETIYSVDDFRITIDTNSSGGLNAQWYDFFTGEVQDSLHLLPLKVEIITDPEDPIDISNNTWLFEFAINAPESYRGSFYSPLGWDLVPGGNGFTKGSPGYYEKYPDILVLEQVNIDEVTNDTSYSGLYLNTNNFPDEYINADGDSVYKPAVGPSHGDQFTIRTYKPFRKEISYKFNIRKESFNTSQNIDLNKIRVVPDPYVVSNIWETNQFGKKLMFNHLPNECKISIFTVAGDFIAEINHNDGKGYEFWDMRTLNDQYISYGLYVYVVSVPNGQKKVGKFLVIK